MKKNNVDNMSRYGKAERILNIAIWIQSRIQGASLKEISEKLEVSHRTAERIRDCLLNIFYPLLDEIETNERIKRWGFKSSMPTLINFTSDDLVELETAKKLFLSIGNKLKAQKVDEIIDKIKSLNKKNILSIENDLEALLEAEGFAVRQYPRFRINPEIVLKIREAIISQKVLSFDYQIKDKKIKNINVYPYGLLYGDKTYLVAYNDYVKDYRLYELSKINNINVKDEFFNKDNNFNLTEYTHRSFGIYQEEPYEIILEFSKGVAEEIKNYHFHPTQQVLENSDGTITVTFISGGSLAICWELFKWGENVQIYKPLELKNMYLELLRKTLHYEKRNYSSS